MLFPSGEKHQSRVGYECFAMLFLQAQDGDFTWSDPVSVRERGKGRETPSSGSNTQIQSEHHDSSHRSGSQ